MINMLPITYQWLIQRLLPKNLKQKLRVLDLGCGTGIFGRCFNTTHKYYLTGVDIFAPYVRQCRQLDCYDKVIKADITSLSLNKQKYDVIVLFQALEHLPKSQAISLLKKVTKAARTAVLVTVPHGECNQDAYHGNSHQRHRSIWTPGDLVNLGFSVYGQGLRVIYGNESYGTGRRVSWWQFLAVPASLILIPLVLIKSSLAAQLIAVKYIHD